MNNIELQRDIEQFIIETFLFGDRSAAPTSDQPLVQSGLVDSTGILEIVTFLESKYGVRTADEELAAENFGSVAAIVRYVLNKRAS